MKYILSEIGHSLPVGVDAHFRRFSAFATENCPRRGSSKPWYDVVPVFREAIQQQTVSVVESVEQNHRSPAEKRVKGILPRRTHALGQGAEETAGVRGPAPSMWTGKEMGGLSALSGDRKGRQSDRPSGINQIFKHDSLPFLSSWRLWGDWSHGRCAERRAFFVLVGFWV